MAAIDPIVLADLIVRIALIACGGWYAARALERPHPLLQNRGLQQGRRFPTSLERLVSIDTNFCQRIFLLFYDSLRDGYEPFSFWIRTFCLSDTNLFLVGFTRREERWWLQRRDGRVPQASSSHDAT
jgi:hypothetical protein